MLKAPIARRYSGGKDIGAACGTLEASQYGGTAVFDGSVWVSSAYPERLGHPDR